MNDIIIFAAVLSACLGAICSTIKGWWKAPEEEKYSKQKLGSAIMVSVFSAFGIVNLGLIPEQFDASGSIGLVITYLLLGFGIDQAKS